MTGAAAIGCMGAAAYLQSTEPRTRPRPAAEIAAPAVAPFTWQMGVADGLAGPPTDGERLPWESLRIASNLSLDYVPAGKTGQQCLANSALNTREGIVALTELRAILAAMPSQIDCGEACPSCMEVSLQWLLDDDRGTATLQYRRNLV